MTYGIFCGLDIIMFANSIKLSDGVLSGVIDLVGSSSLYDLPNLEPKSNLVRIDPLYYISPSEMARKVLFDQTGILNVAVIHPGINLKNFAYNESIRWNVYSDDEFLVGFVGRVETEKSLGLVVEMIEELVQSRLCSVQRCRFIFVGAGLAPPFLKSFARRLGIDDRLEFWGPIFKGLGNVMSTFDVLINPSLRSTSETFCIVNIEAFAVGLPIVSFGSGGVMDYLRDKENGLLVRVADGINGTGMAIKIEEFSSLPVIEKIRMGRRATLLVQRDFRVEQMILKYEQLMVAGLKF